MEHSYKLIVAYDGTDYHGWQRQKGVRSVDHVIRETFLRSFYQKDLLLVGASRTDAGVHTRGQVVRLRTQLDLIPSKLQYILNRSLPPDIVVMDCEKVPSRFHPQHGVLQKTYTYTFSLKKLSPMVGRYCYVFPHPLDVALFREALETFVGTHDFRSFVKEESDKNTIRTVDTAALEPSACGQFFIITIKGRTFLRYMIRRMVGAAFVVASRRTLTIDDLRNQLSGSAHCTKLLITAPAKGLCLESIEYLKGE